MRGRLTALALIVYPDHPQQKDTTGQTNEAVNEHADGDTQHLGRCLGDHGGVGEQKTEDYDLQHGRGSQQRAVKEGSVEDKVEAPVALV